MSSAQATATLPRSPKSLTNNSNNNKLSPSPLPSLSHYCNNYSQEPNNNPTMYRHVSCTGNELHKQASYNRISTSPSASHFPSGSPVYNEKNLPNEEEINTMGVAELRQTILDIVRQRKLEYPFYSSSATLSGGGGSGSDGAVGNVTDEKSSRKRSRDSHFEQPKLPTSSPRCPRMGIDLLLNASSTISERLEGKSFPATPPLSAFLPDSSPGKQWQDSRQLPPMALNTCLPANDSVYRYPLRERARTTESTVDMSSPNSPEVPSESYRILPMAVPHYSKGIPIQRNRGTVARSPDCTVASCENCYMSPSSPPSVSTSSTTQAVPINNGNHGSVPPFHYRHPSYNSPVAQQQHQHQQQQQQNYQAQAPQMYMAHQQHSHPHSHPPPSFHSHSAISFHPHAADPAMMQPLLPAGSVRNATRPKFNYTFMDTKRPRGPSSRWSPEEDELLKQAVGEYGEDRQWVKVAQLVPGRTNLQCRQRWLCNIKAQVAKENGNQK